jgi:hypothetical protein
MKRDVRDEFIAHLVICLIGVVLFLGLIAWWLETGFWIHFYAFPGTIWGQGQW